MIYLDSNVFVYALSQNVDDIAQKQKALEYLREAVAQNQLIVSEVVLYEFAFVSKKLGEKSQNIKENLEFIIDFIEPTPANLFSKVLDFMNEHNFYRHSFDVYHLCYAQAFECQKFITFDKGFKKLQKYVDMEIEVL
ncbi:MAG: type II toxin-antitoxin system VapC family toxin [Campylobacterales bacterium]|nr:type II toxin-antitoxin system VapC family toxin [Campylobacterales bacterium]